MSLFTKYKLFTLTIGLFSLLNNKHRLSSKKIAYNVAYSHFFYLLPYIFFYNTLQLNYMLNCLFHS